MLTIWSMVYYLQKALPGDPGPGAMTRSRRQRAVRWLRAMPVGLRADLEHRLRRRALGMPHAPPLRFLAVRYALSALCFVVWIALAARAPGRAAARSGCTSRSPAC